MVQGSPPPTWWETDYNTPTSEISEKDNRGVSVINRWFYNTWSCNITSVCVSGPVNYLVDTQANTLVIHTHPGMDTLSFPARLVLENNTDITKLGLILVNDMQTSPPPSFLRSGHIRFLAKKDVQCSETYKKTIFKFLVFAIWSIW